MGVASCSRSENEAAATERREHSKPGMKPVNAVEPSLAAGSCGDSYEDADVENFKISARRFDQFTAKIKNRPPLNPSFE